MRSPDRKLGLSDVTRRASRIKDLTLADAIMYSTVRDIRFVTLTCLLIGFSLLWWDVPEPVLVKPEVLRSPDLGG